MIAKNKINSVNSNERDISIDICRTIFSLLIILAHVNPPKFILNIRSFDVTALVIISGMMIRNNINSDNYIKYLFSRIKKLLIPTYLLIIIVSVTSYIVCDVLKREQLYELNIILESFALVDGIGYVWIVRIYLIIAILSPIIIMINKKIKSNYIIILLGMILIYFNYRLSIRFNKVDNYWLDYILYVIPYTIVALIGLRCYKNKIAIKQTLTLYIPIFIICQLIMYHKGVGFSPTTFKYPPNLYYLSYGVSVGLGIYYVIISKEINIKNHLLNKFIVWSSKNSFTIYLVHIIILMAVNMIFDVIGGYALNNYIVKYIVVTTISLITCYIINFIKFKTSNNFRRWNYK